MKEAVIAIAVVAIISASAVVGIAMMNDGPKSTEESFSITYNLDGGTNSSDNPSSYTSGKAIELKAPTREGYVFLGWASDAELTKEVTEIPEDSKGDLTLYAVWEESSVGTSMTYSITGATKNGFGYNTSTMSGTITFSYVNYEYGKGYLMKRDQSLTVTTGLVSDTNVDVDVYWTGELETEWTEGSKETIETAFGTKECRTWISKDRNSTETQYVGDDNITYLIQYVGKEGTGIMFSSTTSITYSLTEIGTIDLTDEFDVIVYCDKDITVTGSGKNPAYRSVTVTATGDSFYGWFDPSGQLLSKNRSYTIDTFVMDVVLFAKNDNDADVTYQESTATISPTVPLTDVSWTFVDGTETNIDGDTLTHTFSSPGYYTIQYTGKLTDGSTYYGLIDVMIDSLVTKTFNWNYDGDPYQIVLNIRYSDYLAYKNDTTATRHQVNNTRDSIYFTTDDEYIGYIADRLNEFAEGQTSLWKANLALSFVQLCTDYDWNEYNTGNEYWRYPLETLYEEKGDCEDTAFLFATIAKRMGFDCCTMIFSGHMAAGIVVDGCTGYYYDHNSKHYYYCETTSDDWEVGHQPDSNYEQNRVIRYITPS